MPPEVFESIPALFEKPFEGCGIANFLQHVFEGVMLEDAFGDR